MAPASCEPAELSVGIQVSELMTGAGVSHDHTVRVCHMTSTEDATYWSVLGLALEFALVHVWPQHCVTIINKTTFRLLPFCVFFFFFSFLQKH